MDQDAAVESEDGDQDTCSFSTFGLSLLLSEMRADAVRALAMHLAVSPGKRGEGYIYNCDTTWSSLSLLVVAVVTCRHRRHLSSPWTYNFFGDFFQAEKNGTTRTGRCLNPTDTAQELELKTKKLLGAWLRHSSWNATCGCVHVLQET